MAEKWTTIAVPVRFHRWLRMRADKEGVSMYTVLENILKEHVMLKKSYLELKERQDGGEATANRGLDGDDS